jgi:hypothetical protein
MKKMDSINKMKMEILIELVLTISIAILGGLIVYISFLNNLI